MADDRVILTYFIGDSSRLCHYWNFRFPLGLLAILLAIADRFSSSGLHVCWKIGTIVDARVGGMAAERVKTAARMLPDAMPLIPMEAQSPLAKKGLRAGEMSSQTHLPTTSVTSYCRGNRVRKQLKTVSVDNLRLRCNA